MSETTKMGKVKTALKYLKYISPFYLARTGINKLLNALFNRSLDDYKNDSPKIFVIYLVARRVIRQLRRDGLAGLTEPTFIGIIGTVIVFYLCKKSYENATEEYTVQNGINLDHLKHLGKIPESYTSTVTKPTVTEHFLSFIVSEGIATQVSNNVSFIVTPVYETIDFVWESVKNILYFLVSRSIFFIVLGILGAGVYFTSGIITYIIGALLVFVGIVYTVTELSQSEYYNETVRPKIVDMTRPLDEKMTEFEIFTLGLTPKPNHIPETLREEWGVPDPEEYDGELDISRENGEYSISRLE